MLQGRFGMLQTPSCLICHAFVLSCVLSLSSSFYPPPPSLPLPFPLPDHSLSCCFSGPMPWPWHPLFTLSFFFFFLSSAQFSLHLHVFIQRDAHPLAAKINHETPLLNALYSDLFLMSLWRAARGFSLYLFFSLCCRLFSAGCGNRPLHVKSVQSAFLGSSLLVQYRLMWGQHTLILLLSEAWHCVKLAAQQN